jgi:hypothetical protein
VGGDHAAAWANLGACALYNTYTGQLYSDADDAKWRDPLRHSYFPRTIRISPAKTDIAKAKNNLSWVLSVALASSTKSDAQIRAAVGFVRKTKQWGFPADITSDELRDYCLAQVQWVSQWGCCCTMEIQKFERPFSEI